MNLMNADKYLSTQFQSGAWDDAIDRDVGKVDKSALDKRIPLTLQSEEDKKMVQLAISESAECTNMHSHTRTCRGGHDSCRLGYDQLLQEKTKVLRGDFEGMLVVRRDHGMLTHYMMGLSLACPGNHTMRLAFEASRPLRDLQLWKDNGKIVR